MSERLPLILLQNRVKGVVNLPLLGIRCTKVSCSIAPLVQLTVSNSKVVTISSGLSIRVGLLRRLLRVLVLLSKLGLARNKRLCGNKWFNRCLLLGALFNANSACRSNVLVLFFVHCDLKLLLLYRLGLQILFSECGWQDLKLTSICRVEGLCLNGKASFKIFG